MTTRPLSAALGNDTVDDTQHGAQPGVPCVTLPRTHFVWAVLRRVRPRHAAWALGFAVAIHVVATLSSLNKTFMAPATFLKSGLLIEFLCVLLAMAAVLLADEWVSRGARRWPTYLLCLSTGLALASWAQWELRAALGWLTMLSNQTRTVTITQPLQLFLQMLLWAGLACVIYVKQSRARQAQAQLHAAALVRVVAERRTLESKLQAMQARVEPQFLFNTLAQVRALYESDASAAHRMLSELIGYLRAALPHMRESSSTMGQELELARAYLNIMQVRLGSRLELDFDVPAELANARLPPMMLLPLIDHALVYGLQPPAESGSIHISISTRAINGRLQLTIFDSGAGFVPAAGAGAGLLSVAERLQALYGNQARFVLERMNDPAADAPLRGGTRAILEIPYEDTPR